jgi:O-antigen/teichoic acid export membrane protein
MNGIRSALLLATADRYFGLAINFLQLAVISRLLSPEEIGVSAIGTAVMMFVLSLREFATANFLIQKTEITREDVRTSLTVLLIFTSLIVCVCFVGSGWIGQFYAQEGLASYLQVVVLALLVETFSIPIRTLLWREMAFKTITLINVVSNALGVALSVVLAILGFSYMSLAWAWFAGSATVAGLAIYFRPDFWMFRPSLSNWRGALAFGGYNGAVVALKGAYDSLPYLALGRILPLDAVGQYNRSVTVCNLIDRLIVAAVGSVAFPAFSAEAREGRSLKRAYLGALEHITVLQWPALILLAVLAHPLVVFVLGRQWLAVVPLVQIMAIATLFTFQAVFTHPILIAAGAMRRTLILNLVALPVSALVLCLSATFGLMAMAASFFLTNSFQLFVSLLFVRRHVPFRWSELATALARSLVVTAFSAIGPLAVVAVAGSHFALSIEAALVATLLSATGWAAGLALTRHPMLLEIRHIGEEFRRSRFGVQLIGTVRDSSGAHAQSRPR